MKYTNLQVTAKKSNLSVIKSVKILKNPYFFDTVLSKKLAINLATNTPFMTSCYFLFIDRTISNHHALRVLFIIELIRQVTYQCIVHIQFSDYFHMSLYLCLNITSPHDASVRHPNTFWTMKHSTSTSYDYLWVIRKNKYRQGLHKPFISKVSG